LIICAQTCVFVAVKIFSKNVTSQKFSESMKIAFKFWKRLSYTKGQNLNNILKTNQKPHFKMKI
jgi:hypothetical protein